MTDRRYRGLEFDPRAGLLSSGTKMRGQILETSSDIVTLRYEISLRRVYGKELISTYQFSKRILHRKLKRCAVNYDIIVIIIIIIVISPRELRMDYRSPALHCIAAGTLQRAMFPLH